MVLSFTSQLSWNGDHDKLTSQAKRSAIKDYKNRLAIFAIKYLKKIVWQFSH
jgi:hypothetical protein